MLSKSFTAFIFLFALTSSVNANCVFTPAIGLPNAPVPGDAQQPSNSQPCGNISISQNLDSATPIVADSSGNFKITAINFVAGTPGSRSISSVRANSDGTGGIFSNGKVVDNGDEDPQSGGTQQLTAQLPNGIKCTGGPNKNLCIAALVTTAGYGNCVAVAQPQTTTQESTSTGEKKQTDALNGGQAKTGNDGSHNGNGGQTTNTNAGQTASDQKTGSNTPNHKKRMVRRRL